MGINLFGNCLASCKEIVEDLGVQGSVDKAAITSGMHNLSASMEQSRKELEKRQDKKKKSLERRNANGRN
ncbi:MAG: hypothetical protein E7251_01780 [Paenibacillaceae bacterium]|nr:hypothetical protein [Paenibacillaceae bacterium]